MSSPLSDGWGEFLSQFAWDWYVTLTFAGDIKTFTARNRCGAWLRSLEKAAGQPIAWFRGDEYGEKFGKFHMHLLIANVSHLHRFTFMERWNQRNGYARIFPFDPSKGAAFYVSKYVTKKLGEWDLSGNVAAFRIQQGTLPLVGQRGMNPQSPRTVEPQRRNYLVGAGQIPLGDFTHPDLNEIDSDEIRSDFREQTRRKR